MNVAKSPSSKCSKPALRKGCLPARLHCVLQMSLTIAGVMFGLLMAMKLNPPALNFLFMAAFAYLGGSIPHRLFQYVLPARCTACGGRCWPQVGPPAETIKYECENCPNAVDSKWGSGGGGGGGG